MGARGPAPTPKAILRLRGSPGGAEPENAVHPQMGRPTPPTWLHVEARAVWDVLIEQLESMGVLALCDSWILVRYCVTYAQWVRAVRWIDEKANPVTGPVWVKTDDAGKMIGIYEYPQVFQAGRLGQQLAQMEASLGLSPAARTRLRAEVEMGGGIDLPGAGAAGDKGRFFG